MQQTCFCRTSSFFALHDWCGTSINEVCPSTVSVRYSSVLGTLFLKRRLAETSVIVSRQSAVASSHLLIEFQTEAERQGWNATLNYVSYENRSSRNAGHDVLPQRKRDTHIRVFHDSPPRDTWAKIATNNLRLLRQQSSAVCAIITDFTLRLCGKYANVWYSMHAC